MVPKLPKHLEELQKNPLCNQVFYLGAWSRAWGSRARPLRGAASVPALGEGAGPSTWSRCLHQEVRLPAAVQPGDGAATQNIATSL